MDQRPAYWIKRVQQAFRLEMDSNLKQLNQTTAQYAALNALEETPSASNAELARRCFITPQTMIEIIRSLEATNLITRQSHPEHGRIIQTVITKEGSKKLAKAHQIVEKIEERMLKDLKSSERQDLIAYLERCLKNLSVK